LCTPSFSSKVRNRHHHRSGSKATCLDFLCAVCGCRPQGMSLLFSLILIFMLIKILKVAGAIINYFGHSGVVLVDVLDSKGFFVLV